MSPPRISRSVKAMLGGSLLASCVALTGCMGEYAGQNLPTPYYLGAQIQYFPPGPEFKLTREAMAQKEYRESVAQREGVLVGPQAVPVPAAAPAVIPPPPAAIPPQGPAPVIPAP